MIGSNAFLSFWGAFPVLVEIPFSHCLFVSSNVDLSFIIRHFMILHFIICHLCFMFYTVDKYHRDLYQFLTFGTRYPEPMFSTPTAQPSMAKTLPSGGAFTGSPYASVPLPLNMVGALAPFFGTSSESFDDWLGIFDLCIENNSEIVRVNTGLPLTLMRSCMQGAAGKALVALAKKGDDRLSDYQALRKYLSVRFRPFRTDARRLEAVEKRKLAPSESVHDYAQDIRDLGLKAYGDNAEESILIYRFCEGLPPGMAGAVKMTHSKTLDDATEVALTFEETYGRTGGTGHHEKKRSTGPEGLAPVAATPIQFEKIDKVCNDVEELLNRQQKIDTRLQAVERTLATRSEPKPGNKRDANGQSVSCSYCGRPNHTADRCRSRGMDAWMAANPGLLQLADQKPAGRDGQARPTDQP
jgi:hypothetical protein